MTIEEIHWLERTFISAYTLDDNGVAQLSPTETKTNGDELVNIRGKYGSVSTSNANAVQLALPWVVEDGELWFIKMIVTAKGAGVRRVIEVSALVYGDGAVATFDGAPGSAALGTGSADATLSVSGASILVEVQPVAATPLVWGFEVRGQQL